MTDILVLVNGVVLLADVNVGTVVEDAVVVRGRTVEEEERRTCRRATRVVAREENVAARYIFYVRVWKTRRVPGICVSWNSLLFVSF